MKHDPEPKILVELIQFLARIKAIHQNSEKKRDCGDQVSISSSLIVEISLSSIPWGVNDFRSDWEQEL